MVRKLLDRAMSVVGSAPPRRSVLARAAVGASAAAVAPIRYLTRPVSAIPLITCSDCSSGSACCDGWTTFCCSLPGGSNAACPSYAFVGGWWQCNYSGSALCNPTNVRYIVDCNRKASASCPGGCHCANDQCIYRRTCCNDFRYGQCNTDIAGTTEVVCRLVTCVIPCKIDCLHCNCTAMYNQVTCS